MPEGTQIADAQPAMAAQIFGTFTCGHSAMPYALRASVDRKVGCVDNLFPFGGFVRDQLAEIGR